MNSHNWQAAVEEIDGTGAVYPYASPGWKLAVNWDKVLGLATVLAVVALGWTAVGFAVSRFLR